ncbi:MAG: hypothetical protein SV775_10070, partial [Thermodesulfobacteriota bacterium]|nr:hypothetical protein [Thermodesulfobacteriota bacterium]
NLAIVRWCLSPHAIAKMELEDFFKLVAPRYRGQAQYKKVFEIWKLSPYSIGDRPQYPETFTT